MSHFLRDENDGAPDEPLLIPLPEFSPIRFTTATFPRSAAAKDAAGIPWGLSITPCLPPSPRSPPQPPLPSHLLARCDTCFAYINPYCEVNRRWWRCSLCGAHVSLRGSRPTVSTGSEPERYRQHHASSRVPELVNEVVDLDLPFPGDSSSSSSSRRSGGDGDRGGGGSAPAARPPVYVALVDELGGDAFQAAVSQALVRAAAALPPHHHFALLTFSDRLGVFDAAAPLPVVRFVRLIDTAAAAPGAAAAPIDLLDVATLGSIAAAAAEHRAGLCSAAEALPSVCAGAASTRRRCTAGAIAATLDMVLACRGTAAAAPDPPPAASAEDGFEFASCHVNVFLAGAEAAAAAPAAVRAHYATLAQSAAPRGVSFSVWAVPENSTSAAADAAAAADGVAAAQCGLAQLQPLTALTGGALHHNELLSTPPDAAAAAAEQLAQAVAWEAARTAGHAALLRVRCSSGFRVRQAAGSGAVLGTVLGTVPRLASPAPRCFADPQLDALWHVARCPAGASLNFNFEFDGVGDLLSSGDGDAHAPVIQVAFAYTDACGFGGDGGGDGGGGVWVEARRRLRVITARCSASHDSLEVTAGLGPNTAAASLLPKALAVAHSEGAIQAAHLLRDWAVNLCCCVVEGAATAARSADRSSDHSSSLPERAADAARDPAVHRVLQLTYGLLHAVADAGGASDAATAAADHLLSLDPGVLRLELYPSLRTFSAEGAPRSPGELPLRRAAAAAAAANGAPLLVLDAMALVHVHRAEAAGSRRGSVSSTGAAATVPPPPPQPPFPPPAGTPLGDWLEARAVVACAAPPRLEFSSGAGTLAFETLLLDDCAPAGAGASGFSDFFSQVVAAAQAALGEE